MPYTTSRRPAERLFRIVLPAFPTSQCRRPRLQRSMPATIRRTLEAAVLWQCAQAGQGDIKENSPASAAGLKYSAGIPKSGVLLCSNIRRRPIPHPGAIALLAMLKQNPRSLSARVPGTAAGPLCTGPALVQLHPRQKVLLSSVALATNIGHLGPASCSCKMPTGHSIYRSADPVRQPRKILDRWMFRQRIWRRARKVRDAVPPNSARAKDTPATRRTRSRSTRRSSARQGWW
jgi:hypothetical protein